jgi:hypothetical protein
LRLATSGSWRWSRGWLADKTLLFSWVDSPVTDEK